MIFITQPATFYIFPSILILLLPVAELSLGFLASFSASHSPRGSSVTTISLRWRMSFHRGTGGGLGGASSWHTRVLVSKTMWLYSMERPYWRRISGKLVWTPTQRQRDRNKHTSSTWIKHESLSPVTSALGKTSQTVNKPGWESRYAYVDTPKRRNSWNFPPN